MRKVYACYNKDEDVQKKSSSGGVFFELAKYVFEKNGVVFGARFNDSWEVEHAYCETINDIIPILKSKYVQSSIGDTYRKTKEFLQNGRMVLFCGTPCQITGLKSYLQKDYENLIAVDFICHGVPSRKVWREYLSIVSDGGKIRNIDFRDKTEGWENYSLKIEFEDGSSIRNLLKNDLYMKGFLKDIYLRPSCYNCKFKGFERNSDITIGDFWGVKENIEDMYNFMGTSVILCHSVKGNELWQEIQERFVTQLIDENILKNTNSAVYQSVAINPKREKFYSMSGHLCEKIMICGKEDKIIVIKRKIRNVLKRVLKVGKKV